MAGLTPAILLKKRLQHRCFPVNFAKSITTPSFTEHLQTTASVHGINNISSQRSSISETVRYLTYDTIKPLTLHSLWPLTQDIVDLLVTWTHFWKLGDFCLSWWSGFRCFKWQSPGLNHRNPMHACRRIESTIKETFFEYWLFFIFP